MSGRHVRLIGDTTGRLANGRGVAFDIELHDGMIGEITGQWDHRSERWSWLRFLCEVAGVQVEAPVREEWIEDLPDHDPREIHDGPDPEPVPERDLSPGDICALDQETAPAVPAGTRVTVQEVHDDGDVTVSFVHWLRVRGHLLGEVG